MIRKVLRHIPPPIQFFGVCFLGALGITLTAVLLAWLGVEAPAGSMAH